MIVKKSARDNYDIETNGGFLLHRERDKTTPSNQCTGGGVGVQNEVLSVLPQCAVPETSTDVCFRRIIAKNTATYKIFFTCCDC